MWEAYIRKRGSLHVGLHVEASIAVLSALVMRAMGDKTAKPTDFMPHYDEPELSIEDAFKLFN